MSVMSHSFRYDDFERLVYGAMLLNSNFFEEAFLEIARLAHLEHLQCVRGSLS